MALSQSLSTGITGLMSHQKAMDNLGNNLANVNTTGFKQGVYQFSNMLHQSIRGGMGADGTTGRGSVNPVSMGMGTQTASINKVFTQGNLENTNNPYDMAISGNGFFVVRQGNGYAYTRDGSFFRGEDGYLMNYSGLYVQGTMAVRQPDGSFKIPADAKMEDINIPIGSVGGHSQTTEASFTGNLNSSQKVSSGTNLFGSSSFPSVNNIQAWMPKDFNGGDSTKTDTSWNSLEKETYGIPKSVYELMDDDEKLMIDRNSDIKVYNDGVITNLFEEYEILDDDGNVVETKNRNCDYVMIWGIPDDVDEDGNPIPGEIEINGKKITNGSVIPVEYFAVDEDGNPSKFLEVNADNMNDITLGGVTGLSATPMMREVNVINGGNVQSSAEFAIRVPDEAAPNGYRMEPADLDTDIGDLWYKKGNTWIQPFPNVTNGDEISLSFSKGESQAECTFVYNKPGPQATLPGQISINQEKSHTLEHFLIFLAGDVDKPMTACQNISPEMFGYEEGMVDTEWDSAGYQKALSNTSLATTPGNYSSTGGALGLLSLPPHISDKNGGTAAYDVPGESAGAFTRTGADGSFYVSLVSNLGAQNALSDISITYKDVPHETMFSSDTNYGAEQGGSAMTTVEYYDSLGNPKTAVVRMAMVEQDDNFTTWRWYADSVEDSDFGWVTDADGNITTNFSVGTGVIRFDKEGNYVSGAELSETDGITIDQRKQGVNNPIWIKVTNGLSSNSTQDLDFSRLTCTADSKKDNTMKLYNQNGRPPGVLTEFAVGLDGTIQGVYDNGNIVLLARIGLALIPNETGLICAGGNLFYAGPASGDPQYGHAGSGGLGTIHQSQLETSNVELSVEFTKIITIERGFQANSRTITTADEMIQELLNLKR